MYKDEEGYYWGEREDDVGTVILYTNRAVMAFTPRGHQIPYYQKGWDEELILELIDKGRNFYVAKWREWMHEITRDEFAALCGFKAIEGGGDERKV
jgi:hypothetical protein